MRRSCRISSPPKPDVKVELVSAIGERNIAGSVETLLKTARDEDRKVRIESLKVLKIGRASPRTCPRW